MKLIPTIVIFALFGLVAGYVVFGSVNGKYINPVELFLPAEGLNLFKAAGEASGIYQKTRNNILFCAAGGAAVGLAVALYGRRRR
jgi:hypothetical protein